eukprot:1524391-Prymnesium_polylepis.2
MRRVEAHHALGQPGAHAVSELSLVIQQECKDSQVVSRLDLGRKCALLDVGEPLRAIGRPDAELHEHIDDCGWHGSAASQTLVLAALSPLEGTSPVT